jgi:hypothetical protein
VDTRNEISRSNTVPLADTVNKFRTIIYLACPYTHINRAVREQRYQAATSVAAALIKRGYVVYSPVTMTHPIDTLLAGEASTLGTQYWTTFDEAFMDVCSEMLVVDISGWKESEGIKREMDHFRACGKSIRYVNLAGEISSTPHEP